MQGTPDGINILYLLKVLKTKKLSDLVAAIDSPPLDVNIAIWDAIDRGEIEVDDIADKVVALKDPYASFNPALASKLIRVIQQYAGEESNVSRGRLAGYMKDPVSNQGYPMHEYLMTLQHLIDEGEVLELTIEIPEVKNKRPKHTFVFLCLPGNDNEEWNARAVNKWLVSWQEKPKKNKKKK